MRVHKELNQNEHQNYLWQTARMNSAVSWTSEVCVLCLEKGFWSYFMTLCLYGVGVFFGVSLQWAVPSGFSCIGDRLWIGILFWGVDNKLV